MAVDKEEKTVEVAPEELAEDLAATVAEAPTFESQQAPLEAHEDENEAEDDDEDA